MDMPDEACETPSEEAPETPPTHEAVDPVVKFVEQSETAHAITVKISDQVMISLATADMSLSCDELLRRVVYMAMCMEALKSGMTLEEAASVSQDYLEMEVA